MAIFCAQEGGIFNFQRNKTDPPQAQAAVQAGAYGGGAAGRGCPSENPTGGGGERGRGERPQGRGNHRGAAPHRAPEAPKAPGDSPSQTHRLHHRSEKGHPAPVCGGQAPAGSLSCKPSQGCCQEDGGRCQESGALGVWQPKDLPHFPGRGCHGGYPVQHLCLLRRSHAGGGVWS